VLAGVLLAASACRNPAQDAAVMVDTEAVIVTDSAGMRIVRSARPRHEGNLRWRLSDDWIVEIGAADDSVHALFDVAGSVLLMDGRIVVAQRTPPMIRWFSGEGEYLTGTGRAGRGPGEYGGEGARIARLWWLPGDSVATWEHADRRMQLYGPGGEFVRSVVLELPPEMPALSYPQVAGRSGRGFVLFLRTPPRPGVVGEVRRDSMPYLHYDSTGGFDRVLATLPGFVAFTTDAQSRGAGNFPAAVPLPFAPGPVSDVGTDGFHYGSGESFEIRRYDTTGNPDMLIRRAHDVRDLDNVAITLYKGERLSLLRPGAQTAPLRQALDNVPYPERLPAVQRLFIDRDRMVWVQEYTHPADAETRWSVFDPTGVWITDVMVPNGVEILDVSGNHVLVLVRDESDIEIVRLHTLVGRTDA
jgi:hypothetical protein